MTRESHVSAAGAMMLLVFLTHCEANRAFAASAVAVARSESVAPVAPGTIIEIDRSAHSPTEDLVLRGLRGTAQRPIVVRGKGPGLAVVRGRFELVDAAFVTVQRLRIEPAADDRGDRPLVRIEGERIRVDDLEVVGGPSDGVHLSGNGITLRGGRVSACEGWGVVAEGEVRIDGLRAESCRRGGLQFNGQALVANSLFLHNRGPGVDARPNASVRFYHNLVYDNGGGLSLERCRAARVLNNLFVNNYPALLGGPDDAEIRVAGPAQIDYNVYFRHPAKDKLLRGLPYGQGVDLSSSGTGGPFGLRWIRDGRAVASLAEKPWADAFDAHSQSLDILQRLTGRNAYTRSYEDLFADLQQEDFRPRYTSPAIGRGVDRTAEVATDLLGRPRSSRHPDIGPYAAPAAWWSEIDAGRAVFVDGTVARNAAGWDCGLGTPERPFATLGKAAALARLGTRIYVKDSIYRDTAMQTSFSFGPDGALCGYPGHRPAFSPSEHIEPQRWRRVSADGLFRLPDWHTFLGGHWRLNAWMLDYYGNARIGGPGENVTSLSRNTSRRADPFRPIRQLTMDRDTPQVLCDGVALQQAGGVLGLEEFPIGTMSAWGRDPAHLRPGSFMVGRRDFLVSSAVGRAPLTDGQTLLEGPNPHPEMNYRIDGHSVGYVSRCVARPKQTWHATHTYPGGDRLWRLDPTVTSQFGGPLQRRLADGWRRVAHDKDSACWVRQFALPVATLRVGDGVPLARREGGLPRGQLPVGAWLQRQCQTGDPALAAAFEHPYQDYLEVRLPAGADPNAQGIAVEGFDGRVEAVWRKSIDAVYTPSVNAPGVAMLSAYRTMEVGATHEATAATASQPWQFGFVVALGATAPEFLMRMPAAVDPNREDPWKFTVVDDSLYVFLPQGASPGEHAIEAACNSTCYMPFAPGGNSAYYDWADAGPLRSGVTAARVYRTEIDFGRDAHEPLWSQGEPIVISPGFELDLSDATGRTLHLLDEVRLDDADTTPSREDRPHEKTILVRYFEGDPATTAPREHRVSSRTMGPDRRLALPSKPAAFPRRYALLIAPADQPDRTTEPMIWRTLRAAPSREELVSGTYYVDAAAHAMYVAMYPGSEPVVSHWTGGRTDPFAVVRGLYCLGGNAYGHQKQYGWNAGLGAMAALFDDVSVGFSPGNNMIPVPGGVVRDCLFRWAGADVGRGGEVSGAVRHTADRIGRPEFRVDHSTFDVSNSFLFDGNDNPTKNIPFANHHIWERSYFLSAMCGMQGPWWDQYGFNNVVQNCVFAGRGGVDVEVCENLIVRNNLFASDKGMLATYRGSDRAYIFNNTTFRGGGVWFFSSPERANATEQGAPCYGPSFPIVDRGPVPWLSIEPLRHEKGISLDVRWLPAAEQAEVYYCENWDQASPLLIDGKGFASYRPVGAVAQMTRGTYFHDPAARRLYIRLLDGGSPQSRSVPPPHIPQGEAVRRDLVYLLTVVRPGRLSMPHRALSRTEIEVIEPLRPGDTVEASYYDAGGRRTERFPISAERLARGRPRLRLSAAPSDDRLFVGRAGERPPMVRVTGSWTDVRPFEAELIPGASIVASSLMGMEFRVLREHFPRLKQGDQFESVFHSRSVYHMACLDNVFLDMRSSVAFDRMDNPSHGANFYVQSELADASHSKIDYNCYWKDLQAAPGPLSALVHWGKQQVWSSTGDKQGITLAEFRDKTGYEAHGMAPPSYFHLVCNPLRFDFRPLPDSPLLGAGVATREQVGTFLFDPDPLNGNQRFTYKGNQRDLFDRPRGERPTLGAVERPKSGARAFYVAPDGKDGPQRGDRTAPLATFAAALARMMPGDLLVIQPGKYREPLVVRRSGTPKDFLHIVAANPPYSTPERFRTTGATTLDAACFGDTPAVLLDGCAHVRVAGLRVEKSAAAAAVELRQTRDCVVEYVFVDAPRRSGIRATGVGNTLYECRVSGGVAGYELAGRMGDVRWCAAIDCATGFRTVGPTAGLLLLQNRHVGGKQAGFVVGSPAADVAIDGNWVDSAACGYRLEGQRILAVNNIAENVGAGMRMSGCELRVFHNSLVRCAGDGLALDAATRSALVLNNLVQADGRHVVVGTALRDGAVWCDYNVYSRATLPFALRAQRADRLLDGIEAWRSATGWDRNSNVAPLVYSKSSDLNGRLRIRAMAVSVSNLTPHFNVGPLGANAYPYTGGGTYILDIPENWKPCGEPSRRVWQFDTQPGEGALSARAHWYLAKLDYRRKDGTRGQRELYRVDGAPGALPPGTFGQDTATARVYVRLPDDADDPCPIGTHRRLAPAQAVGYYVGRGATGAAEKYSGKLVTPALAAGMAQEGIGALDAVGNVLSCFCGTPTLEQGCPILGIARDADGMARPSAAGTMCAFGCWNAPGRFDVGAAEHGYFVP